MPTEAEIVGNSRLDHLYNHEWTSGEGKFLNLVIDDSGQPQGVDIQLEPRSRNRIKVQISFVRDRGEITKIELKKFKHYSKKGWQPCPDDTGYGFQHLSLRPFSFEKLVAFLRFVSELDIAGLTERRLSLTVEGTHPLDEETKRKVRSLLVRQGGSQLITEMLKTDLISEDIVNLGFRKQQLDLFRSLLTKSDEIAAYQSAHGLRTDQPESAWQHFFSRNEWIFGYGLDYRFQGILQEQFFASDTEADGSQSVISDFLLGDKRFTTFVEIKRSDTPLFGQRQNRSRAWKLSTDLLDSVSQILEQKASGLLKFERGALHDDAGRQITQKPYDPKIILIIGNWNQLSGATERERETKQRTLELFRRDSRNIEIVTYDELLDRAEFIVRHRKRPTVSAYAGKSAPNT